MSQRLVWNFELVPKNKLSLPSVTPEAEEIKWEIRYFWPAEQIIKLYLIDPNLMSLSNYKQKRKEDYYYLIPNASYNIKLRGEQILYKPLLKQALNAQGFGPKIPLNTPESNRELPFNWSQIEKKPEIRVTKESVTYKFASSPQIKLELSRLVINGSIFFSACIEGKSLKLVELIDAHLLENEHARDYVGFLQSISS